MIQARLIPWWTRLLSLWRAQSRRFGPPGRLTEEERHQLGASLKELSRGLTRDRGLAGTPYLEDPALLGAYLLYFWPASYAQFLWVRAVGLPGPLGRVLDLGCGPGPVALAAKEEGATDVWALDARKPALDWVRLAAQSGGLAVRTLLWQTGRPLPEGPFDTVTCGHFLNELAEAEVMALMGALKTRLAPGARVLWMEPASLEINRRLLGLRDRLVEAGWTLDGPCFWKGACPALAAGPEGACHAAYAWSPPEEYTRLAWAARLGKEQLKMTWFVWRAPGPSPAAEGPASPAPYRVIGDPLVSKSGRTRVLVCGEAGRFSLSVASAGHEEAPPADLRRAFDGLRRGDVVDVRDPLEREAGWSLGPASGLRVLKPVPRA